MPMNPIQFQRGMPLPEFFAGYGTEAQCEATLARARWPHGFRCPACGHEDYTCLLYTSDAADDAMKV